MNAHHEQWLESSMMMEHREAALDFASSSGCKQMVMKPHTSTEGS